MTLSDVIEKWGLPASQVNELFEITGTVDKTFIYATLVYHGISMEDIRWLYESNLFYMFKSDDWVSVARLVKTISENCGIGCSDVLRSLLRFVNDPYEPEAPMAAIQFLGNLKSQFEDEYEFVRKRPHKKASPVRHIRVGEATT
jgi:hypothetical protein